jgi:DNA polymerase eta
MSFLTNTSREDRVIALIDMDCFYAQVEQRERPELWGTPVAVAQYNQWKGGGYVHILTYSF